MKRVLLPILVGCLPLNPLAAEERAHHREIDFSQWKNGMAATDCVKHTCFLALSALPTPPEPVAMVSSLNLLWYLSREHQVMGDRPLTDADRKALIAFRLKAGKPRYAEAEAAMRVFGYYEGGTPSIGGSPRISQRQLYHLLGKPDKIQVDKTRTSLFYTIWSDRGSLALVISMNGTGMVAAMASTH